MKILGGEDRNPTATEVKALRARVKGRRFLLNGERISASAMIHDGVPRNWARAIARLRVRRSLYLDAGNLEADIVTRVE
jgi:hypothetical protein